MPDLHIALQRFDLGFDEVVYLRQKAWKVFGQREIHGDPFWSCGSRRAGLSGDRGHRVTAVLTGELRLRAR